MLKTQKRIWIAIILAVLASILQTGCYRMPDHDEYSVVPTTNNPDVIGKSNSSWMPNAGF
jgi:hypothetical protein